ncbi:MAG: 50S ribosome-binding GTPase [Methanosarcinaceae archaeon]|nr:50S ribosome-binding GTPase [Methanosarcinaceae archaeon]
MAGYKMLVSDVIRQADILLEIVDARFPDETRNSAVEKEIRRAGKPFIIVLNKCDLVSKEKLVKARSRLSGTAPTVFVSGKDRYGTTMLRHRILEVVQASSIRDRDILVGCLGYPNTGKSSVINGVTGRHRAGTSSISGHTRGLQHVNAGSRIKFIDTPGVIPSDESDEIMQGVLGVKDATHLKDSIGVALKIIEMMCSENKVSLESFYKVGTEGQDACEVLGLIGLQNGFLKKKGEVDETRTAIRVINDWQRGQLIV